VYYTAKGRGRRGSEDAAFSLENARKGESSDLVGAKRVSFNKGIPGNHNSSCRKKGGVSKRESVVRQGGGRSAFKGEELGSNTKEIYEESCSKQ